mmetsp:Transcript_6309/g.18159  ORF Transcript_6309/g.18159 Transcript_6309/m.18159 type:complete len:274 (-) Transcript_6309:130-951(-)
MQIKLRFEETDDKELHMTLRLTLPKKYQSGPTRDVVKLFVDHYNKKNAENPLDASALHLKVVGGNHLDMDAKMDDFVASGDECYILGGDFVPATAPPAKRPAESAAPAAPKAAADASKDGKARCKRFGCNRYFDPEGPPQECVHHKAPPIFHETAKWWSCCPDRKAYDWDEFMRIPGCQKSTCSANPEGQDGKRFLGGHDLRGDTAPMRLDADAPKDPRHKLDELRRGAIAVGVDGELFEKVWGKLTAELNGDNEKVCEVFKARFSALLSSDL